MIERGLFGLTVLACQCGIETYGLTEKESLSQTEAGRRT
jgi:hypothetical protein